MSTGNFEQKSANTLPSENGSPNMYVQMASVEQGPGLWNFFNALAFLILLVFIFMSVFWGLSKITAIAEVKKNWKLYRCDPSIMPFASIYGYDAVENFNYCMGSIFQIHSSDITGSFASILKQFTGIISVVMQSVDSARVSLATLGGGINVMFQDFTDRIYAFFFQVRLSAIRIKMLIQRMYATLFSVMYMGMSAITGGVSFSNTVLFSFLDTFCFVPETYVYVKDRGFIPIYEVQIGDTLMPTGSRVTAKFHFQANGQPMVSLDNILVSSNHYIQYNDEWIRVEDHPNAIRCGPHQGSSLICLNTDNHKIPIGTFIFRDYDETEENDVDRKTMKYIENRINGYYNIGVDKQSYLFQEYAPGVSGNTNIRLADGSITSILDVPIGSKLSTGSTIVGKVHREIREFCKLKNSYISAATLVWNASSYTWKRAGDLYSIDVMENKKPIFVSLFVTPSSVIELEDGTVIRDSMELCSPDAEMYYADQLKQLNT